MADQQDAPGTVDFYIRECKRLEARLKDTTAGYKRKDVAHLAHWMRRYMDADDGDHDRVIKMLVRELGLPPEAAFDGVGGWEKTPFKSRE